MSNGELMKKIQALSFAMTEAQLFLDTHPECKTALDYYRRTADELDDAVTEYENQHAPLFADGVSAERWNWIDGPWPWQSGNGMSDSTINEKAGGAKR